MNDKERLDWIHTLKCICCEMLGEEQPLPTEAHHVVLQSYRKHSGGDQATIPLCGFHHRAEPAKWSTGKAQMLLIFGPSLKWQGGKGAFEQRWGTEASLLAKTNQRVPK